jgi:uncharacterized protein YqeY
MTTILDRLKSEMKAAMKSRQKERLGVIRLILSATKQVEVDERIELDDARVIAVLDKMLKQRRESIKQYRDANRVDLAEIEEAEILVIQDFLPKALTEDEITEIVQAAISESSASSIKDMGKVMGIVRSKMIGRADMAVVSTKIKALLGV